jgi:hypothetical protein
MEKSNASGHVDARESKAARRGACDDHEGQLTSRRESNAAAPAGTVISPAVAVHSSVIVNPTINTTTSMDCPRLPMCKSHGGSHFGFYNVTATLRCCRIQSPSG